MLALFLMTAAPQDAAHLLQAARGRLNPGCATPTCGEPPRRSQYRIDSEPMAEVDMTARAFGDTGIDCRTVGGKLCTSRPRTILRTDFTDWP